MLFHIRLAISVNVNLELTIELNLERLYGLVGHPSLPSLGTANEKERSASQMSSATTTSAFSLHFCARRDVAVR